MNRRAGKERSRVQSGGLCFFCDAQRVRDSLNVPTCKSKKQNQFGFRKKKRVFAQQNVEIHKPRESRKSLSRNHTCFASMLCRVFFYMRRGDAGSMKRVRAPLTDADGDEPRRAERSGEPALLLLLPAA